MACSTSRAPPSASRARRPFGVMRSRCASCRRTPSSASSACTPRSSAWASTAARASAFLRVLRAAIHKHGSPEALVSDGGALFKANEALRIDAALGIREEPSPSVRPGSPTASRPSPSKGGWRTMPSPRPRRGQSCAPSMPAGSPTTTTRTIGRTGSAPTATTARLRCWAGSTASTGRRSRLSVSSACAPAPGQSLRLCALSALAHVRRARTGRPARRRLDLWRDLNRRAPG